ncbi:helix-turn-helix domain-containing protein [Arenibacter sp. P308M17]|uniref:helix-turn-helix domain-containing protein n=1 Tax=Arenibacter sp. P308M17 TaxID=2303391 RepID=UPI000E35229F|nr:helix-turn-helix domain-containing protein [Arenibacter sp. P308M17]MCM4163210.1 AraC family transcriptional regulator [Arenibacter sp. A80]RFT57234.1 helix-turn-helix domain-containing protein [Arenibacter sp. P308M17]
MNNSIRTYNKIHSEVGIKIAPFDVAKRYTKPHKHNKYLEIIYFVKGSGFHHMDMVSHSIEPPLLFFVKKDEVHHWEITTKPKGYVIIIKESFLERTLDKYINSQLIKLNNCQKIKVNDGDKSLKALFKALCWEMDQVNLNQEAVEGGLKAILSKMVKYATLQGGENTDRTMQFVNLLSENLKNNVAFYAEALNTTSQNLNALCHKVFNKTASDVIAEHIIMEVKRQLAYTNKPISEIAYDLEFKDTSHFTKYFKRYTQLTPLQYRKKLVLS